MPSILISNEVDRLDTKPVPEADDKILIVDNIEGTLKNGRAESIAALVPDATETVKGVAQLATTAEAEAGVEDTKIMTPLKVSQAIAAQEADTFQEVYDLSITQPQITTNDTIKALQIQRGSAADTDLLIEGKNGAGTTTFSIDGNGDISANSVSLSSNINLNGNNIVNGGSAAFTGGVACSSVDTGQGANELYAMNQDVQTTDNVTFNNISPTGTVDGRDVATDGAKLDTVETNADVTDTANVANAGGLIDTNNLSDVSNAATSLSNIGGIGAATTDTLTNKTFDANGVGNSLSNVDVSDLADGTDGELITWDAAGSPTTVATGTSGQVLTSNGAGAAPTFQDAAGGGAILAYAFGVATNSTTYSSTSTSTFTSISNTSATITKTSGGSKLVVKFYFSSTSSGSADSLDARTSYSGSSSGTTAIQNDLAFWTGGTTHMVYSQEITGLSAGTYTFTPQFRKGNNTSNYQVRNDNRTTIEIIEV